MILAYLANFAHVPATLAMWFQGEAPTVSFSIGGLISNMGWPARVIAIILFIMSIWSLAVMIDRWLYFNAAKKQSREFAPKVAGALKDGRLDEAIKPVSYTHLDVYKRQEWLRPSWECWR